MKLSLTWSLPNGETPPNMNLMAIFFTKAGQGVCQMSETQSGDGEKKIFLPPWHTIPYHTMAYASLQVACSARMKGALLCYFVANSATNTHIEHTLHISCTYLAHILRTSCAHLAHTLHTSCTSCKHTNTFTFTFTFTFVLLNAIFIIVIGQMKKTWFIPEGSTYFQH